MANMPLELLFDRAFMVALKLDQISYTWRKAWRKQELHKRLDR